MPDVVDEVEDGAGVTASDEASFLQSDRDAGRGGVAGLAVPVARDDLVEGAGDLRVEPVVGDGEPMQGVALRRGEQRVTRAQTVQLPGIPAVSAAPTKATTAARYNSSQS